LDHGNVYKGIVPEFRIARVSVKPFQEDSVLHCRIKEWTHTHSLLALPLGQELVLRGFCVRDVPLLTHQLLLARDLCVCHLLLSVGVMLLMLSKGGGVLYMESSRGNVCSYF